MPWTSLSPTLVLPLMVLVQGFLVLALDIMGVHSLSGVLEQELVVGGPGEGED